MKKENISRHRKTTLGRRGDPMTRDCQTSGGLVRNDYGRPYNDIEFNIIKMEVAWTPGKRPAQLSRTASSLWAGENDLFC